MIMCTEMHSHSLQAIEAAMPWDQRARPCAVPQVHYDLWYHGSQRRGATWLRVCRRRSGADPAAPASGHAVPGLAQIRIDGSSSDLCDRSQQGTLGSGEQAQLADPGYLQRLNGSLAPATAVPALAPARGAAVLVRERPQQSVWAPMEYDAMPRWSFMDWMRFYFYRRVWPASLQATPVQNTRSDHVEVEAPMRKPRVPQVA